MNLRSHIFSNLKDCLPFFIGLFSGLCFISLKVTGASFTHYPGDLIDGRFCNYLLEHAHLFFSGHLDSYWSAPFLFPENNVISYSDNLLGSAPFYSMFRFMGGDRESAFQGWYLVVTALNYAACYIFLIVVFKNRYAATIGAMVFAYSMALQCQLGHAQTFARFPIPLAFLMAYLYLKQLKPIYFFFALFFLVYQIYCGIYVGFMLIVPVAMFFLLSLYFSWDTYKLKFKKWSWYFFMLLAFILNVLILLPIMLPYLERSKSLGFYSYEQVSKSLLTPLSYFFSWKGSLFWDFISDIGTHYEWYTNYQVFAGGIATLCLLTFGLIYVLKHWFSLKLVERFEFTPSLHLFFWLAVFTFLGFMRFGDVSLYKVIFQLPGFGSMRALQRIVNIELFFYAIAVAFIFNRIFMRENKQSFFLFLFSVSLVVSDNYMKQDYIHRHEVAESKARISPLIYQLKDLPKHSVVSYEPDSVDSSINDYHLDMMLASQSLNLITLNGYTSTSPDGYSAFWSEPSESTRKTWLSKKNILNQKIVIVTDTVRTK